MKIIDTELYDLAIALADSAARSDIECLCVRTGADRRTYTTDAVRNADKPEVAMAARYLSLREASGEPMPYKVIRDGDKVRFL